MVARSLAEEKSRARIWSRASRRRGRDEHERVHAGSKALHCGGAPEQNSILSPHWIADPAGPFLASIKPHSGVEIGRGDEDVASD